ncbi:hypothetical protein OSB04_007444 [Centaurea solstitialis]|uniref:Tf2-1-like SH3-like domain-containing protein n=1 Tax=Centaurea solstitialis TaxID=347529 RepID=A0AA38TLL1_9ASTR|nr:hypothetical protein OSB04_007444 [Centaurea solstitialis]
MEVPRVKRTACRGTASQEEKPGSNTEVGLVVNLLDCTIEDGSEYVIDYDQVARYVEKCLTCLKVKAEHQKPHPSFKPLEILVWKWEHITMDLITKLPKTPRNFEAIWIIVDRLTRRSREIFLRTAGRYLRQRGGIQARNGSDNYVRQGYPTDEQSEKTIRTLEDMLRACDTYLPLAEFSYNNNYHSSIGMPPYEMLYGRRCRTPICWGEVGQRVLGSTEIVQKTTENIQRIRDRLRTAQSRQKSYADKRHSDLEFQVGDYVLLKVSLLKVSPWNGVIRFRKRGKLGPRFIGPFQVIARVGKMAYHLELPEPLSQIHNTSTCLNCASTSHVPLEDIQVDEGLNYVERPIAVLERKTKALRNKEIGILKHRQGSEWTWEPEAEMRKSYPELFPE